MDQQWFYEDIYDALNKTVNGNPQGLSIKQVACELWPVRNPETARNTLCRALNPENQDSNLDPEEIIKIMELCGPEHVLYFLCDHFGFVRPSRKDKKDFEREIKEGVDEVKKQLSSLLRKVEHLEKGKE